MTPIKCCFLITSLLSILISADSMQKESFDYQDRTCNSHDCFHGVIKSYGKCELSQDKTSCNSNGCKFIGNSNIRLCIDPSKLANYTMAELSKMVLSSSVSIGSQQLCLYDDNGQVYDELCKKAAKTIGGPDTYCHPSSKKCVMTFDQYKKIDSYFEDDIKKNHKLSYDLAPDYTNNILLVVDGTSTKGQFEQDQYDAIKYGEYKMAKKARWSNGNWGNHPSNFYEDYRGAKFYWYGPDYSAKSVSAGSEVHGLVEGVVDIICDFINNATIFGKYEVNDINIDLIGYSRGGYTIMEVGRKLDRDGCPNINKPTAPKIDSIKIRFMGLYDPVSSILECDDILHCHGAMMDGIMNDGGLYSTDDKYYDANVMPTNVKHVVVSYGDPKLLSRAYFNTAEDKADNDKREEVEYKYWKTTHGGIGGTPLDGDYEQIKTYLHGDDWKSLWGLNKKIYGFFMDGAGDNIDYGVDMECTESMKSDMFIRSKANKLGLPIDATDKEYYAFAGCDGHLKE